MKVIFKKWQKRLDMLHIVIMSSFNIATNVLRLAVSGGLNALTFV
jgi:hypothetical protein